MKWVWQQKNWPEFKYESSKLMELENVFQRNIGQLIGSIKHVQEINVDNFKIEVLTQEGLSTSSIEGEILGRDSVQSSIRKHLGFNTDNRKIQPNEAGIAELIVDVYKSYDRRLTHNMMHEWHRMVSNGRRDIDVIGAYRTHTDPMQIVAGSYSNPKVYFEAPPSKIVAKEMEQFVNWYNENINNIHTIPTLLFAGIVHVYFELIHPYEDGNGRIGRALAEKAISQRIGTPSLNSFVKIIERKKRQYYAELQKCNTSLDITDWLLFFSESVIEAQEYSILLIQFIISKTKFFYKFKLSLNPRQEKVLLRMFEEGMEGFQGGLSASNYISIAQTSAATTTRDLQELVSLGAMTKIGERKHTRYYLKLVGL